MTVGADPGVVSSGSFDEGVDISSNLLAACRTRFMSGISSDTPDIVGDGIGKT